MPPALPLSLQARLLDALATQAEPASSEADLLQDPHALRQALVTVAQGQAIAVTPAQVDRAVDQVLVLRPTEPQAASGPFAWDRPATLAVLAQRQASLSAELDRQRQWAAWARFWGAIVELGGGAAGVGSIVQMDFPVFLIGSGVFLAGSFLHFLGARWKEGREPLLEAELAQFTAVTVPEATLRHWAAYPAAAAYAKQCLASEVPLLGEDVARLNAWCQHEDERIAQAKRKQGQQALLTPKRDVDYQGEWLRPGKVGIEKW